MSTIVIKFDGVEITNDVVVADATFTSRTDGSVGEAFLRVRDVRGGPYVPGYFQIGKTVTLDIDGKRIWGGYLFQLTREYAFPVVKTTIPTTRERFWQLTCVDYNILFTKRLVYNRADPTKQLKIYTDDYVTDLTVITDLVTKYLDITAAEGFEMASPTSISLEGVQQVGWVKDANECYQGFQVASPGMTWGDAMRKITEYTGAVFYIAPRADFSGVEHVGPYLMYHANHIETGPYQLTDAFTGGNIRDLIITHDGSQLANEAHVWGAGMGSADKVSHVKLTDQTSVDTYGLFQWGDFSSTMWEEDCLMLRAETYIYGSRSSPRRRGHKDPRVTWTCTLFEPDFLAGDVVSIESTVHEVSSSGIPIREMKVTFPTSVDAKFELTMAHEIPPPWGSAMWWDNTFPPPVFPPGGGGLPWSEFLPFLFPPDQEIGGFMPFEKTIDIDLEHYRFTHSSSGSWNAETVDFLGIGHWITDNTAWSSCPGQGVNCGVGLGCWGPDTIWRQGWYGFKWLAGATRDYLDTTPIGEGPVCDLYIPNQLVKRYGTGGTFLISFVADDYVAGARSAPQTATGRGAPGTVIGQLDIAGTCIENPTASVTWYWDIILGGTSGHGGQRSLEAFVIPAGWIQPYYVDDAETMPEGWEPPINWIVFTPMWDVPNIAVCDDGYVGACGDAAGVGPAHQGQYDSGSAVPMQNITGTVLSTRSFPWSQDETSYAQPLTGTWQSPSPDTVDGEYRTSYPYVPGTLEVFIGGMPLRLNSDFWEVLPAKGTFKLSVTIDLVSVDGINVTYIRADQSPTTWDDWSDYYGEDGYPWPPAAGATGGRVYRPMFRSQLGWGTIHDGENCAAASGATLLDRHTLGLINASPPDIRNASGVSSGGLSLDVVARTLWNNYHEYLMNPGVVRFDTFIKYLLEGRGAMLTGNSNALVPWGLNARSEYTGLPFLGWHSLYVNEVRSDGYLYVYDPAFRVNSKYGISPGWYPPGAIRDYAAPRTGSTDLIWALYTQRQARR